MFTWKNWKWLQYENILILVHLLFSVYLTVKLTKDTLKTSLPVRCIILPDSCAIIFTPFDLVKNLVLVKLWKHEQVSACLKICQLPKKATQHTYDDIRVYNVMSPLTGYGAGKWGACLGLSGVWGRHIPAVPRYTPLSWIQDNRPRGQRLPDCPGYDHQGQGRGAIWGYLVNLLLTLLTVEWKSLWFLCRRSWVLLLFCKELLLLCIVCYRTLLYLTFKLQYVCIIKLRMCYFDRILSRPIKRLRWYSSSWSSQNTSVWGAGSCSDREPPRV